MDRIDRPGLQSDLIPAQNVEEVSRDLVVRCEAKLAVVKEWDLQAGGIPVLGQVLLNPHVICTNLLITKRQWPSPH